MSDFDDGRVKLFNAIGAFESEVGNGPGAGNGQFNNPQGLDLSSANGGRLYVADSANRRIQVFDSTGTFQYKFGTNGVNPENMTFYKLPEPIHHSNLHKFSVGNSSLFC